jgi:hypothetical protein
MNMNSDAPKTFKTGKFSQFYIRNCLYHIFYIFCTSICKFDPFLGQNGLNLKLGPLEKNFVWYFFLEIPSMYNPYKISILVKSILHLAWNAS